MGVVVTTFSILVCFSSGGFGRSRGMVGLSAFKSLSEGYGLYPAIPNALVMKR